MMKKLPILSRSSSASSLKTVGIDSLEEQTILWKVFPVEELHSTLKSDDWQSKQRVLMIIEKWLKNSMDLPKGFMMFSSVQLPIEKYHVLVAVCIIVRNTIDDMDARVVDQALKLAHSLLESAAIQVQKRDELFNGLMIITPKLLSYVSDVVVRDKVIDLLVDCSRLKHFPFYMIVSYLSADSLELLCKETFIGKLTLLKCLFRAKSVKFLPGAVDFIKLMDLLNGGLKNQDQSIRNTAIETCIPIYQHIGDELYEYLEDLIPSTEQLLHSTLMLHTRPFSPKGEEENTIAPSEVLEFESGVLSRELIEKVSKKNAQIQPDTNRMKKYFSKLTHLALDECNIDRIINLHYCTSLRVLYLYKNKIERIEGIYSSHLIHLYLQNNVIKKIEGLERLVNLQKLFLDNNCIECIEGLESLIQLEELHVSNQKLEEGKRMMFEDNSMKGISKSLTTLNASNSNIEEVSSLGYLASLRTLNLSKNRISNLDGVKLILSGNYKLQDIDLSENPVVKITKYRDRVVMSASPSLEILDRSNITNNERIYLRNLDMRKKKAKSSPAHSSEEFDSRDSSFLIVSRPSRFNGPRSIGSGFQREKDNRTYNMINLDQ